MKKRNVLLLLGLSILFSFNLAASCTGDDDDDDDNDNSGGDSDADSDSDADADGDVDGFLACVVADQAGLPGWNACDIMDLGDDYSSEETCTEGCKTDGKTVPKADFDACVEVMEEGDCDMFQTWYDFDTPPQECSWLVDIIECDFS